MKKLFIILPVLVFSTMAQAGSTGHSHQSAYAGQESRDIKSLSARDIAELKRGGGWGLAKTAELNGVPGPAHLLELKNQINLDSRQVEKITRVFKRMRQQAIQKGEKLISLEASLESHFRDKSITDEILRTSLTAIEETRKELRYVHLATHLVTPDILTADQITRYNELRGYTARSTSASPTKGHGHTKH